MDDPRRCFQGNPDFVTTEDSTGIVHIAPTFEQMTTVLPNKRYSTHALTDKDGNSNPCTGKFYRLEDLSPDYIKNSVNVDLYKSLPENM